uniref:Uncharacterized protein n=1 Tax=Timema genevievae TaxID=629358 RepID=A0A7R9JS40_TIMGE|nr:unnamed protein product [Timema genevievae]
MKRAKSFIGHHIKPTIEDIIYEHSTQYGILPSLVGQLDRNERSQGHQGDLVDIKLNLSLIGKRAVEVVSGYLSNGNYEALQGLVTNETLQEVKSNIAEFSMQQRLELALSKEDIYFSFPYQIGVMFNDNDQQRFVEITMCYHVLKGLKELKEQGITPPINMGVLPEYRDKLQICNYRFVREFTKGVNDQWTINVVNHFKPAELER